MKQAIESVEKKGIKSANLKLLAEKGIKLRVDEPCFPIQAHSILQGDGKSPCSIDVYYVNGFNDFHSNQALINKYIKARLTENAYEIKILREELNFIVNAIKVTIKNCTIINNQIEKMASMQNTLMENLVLKEKQVCAMKTRRGT
jgi:hypothetical protein